MKTVLKIILLMLSVAYLVYAVVKLRRPQEERVCQCVEVSVEENDYFSFVDQDYVCGLLAKSEMAIEGENLCGIDLQQIEDKLYECPYIDSVDSYHDDDGTLQIFVSAKRPVLLVMLEQGESYFVDELAQCLPMASYNRPLLVATGAVSPEFAQSALFPLVTYINAHPFWSKQVEQIVVRSPKEVVLYPRVGEYAIILGEVSHIEEKLNNMLLFYQKGFPQVGWNRYRNINLGYKGQIICTRN